METMLIPSEACAWNDLHKINNTVFPSYEAVLWCLSDNVDYNDSDGYYLYEMGKSEGNSSARG